MYGGAVGMFVQFLIAVVWLLEIAIFVRVLLSWIDQNPYPTNEFKRVLFALTDPVLEPLRRVVPPLGMFDITPIVALLLLQVLERVLRSAFGYY